MILIKINWHFLVVNSINLDNIKILKDYALKIHHIIKHFAGSPAILIYLERVKNLTKEKYQEMAQIDIKFVLKFIYFFNFLSR